MTLQPLFNNLLVRVPDEKKETDGGIKMPDSASQDRPQRGTVTAKGPEASVVNVDDEVVFRRYSPDVVEIGEEKFWLLCESDVIAVIR
jgi:chaperonin GroES